MNRPPGPSDFCWWCIDVLSRLLEPDEREAVRGDLAERRSSAGQALRDVLGLVVRRQGGLWIDVRPWIALLAIVIPLGMLLSLVSRWWAESTAIDAFVYLHNGDVNYFSYPGWRNDFIRVTASTIVSYVALSCWSWSTGFALGSLSGRAAWANGFFFAVVVVGEFFAVRQPHGWGNASVFANALYDRVLPLLLRAMFVMWPALMGMRAGGRLGALPLLQATVLAIAVAAFAGLESRTLQFSSIVGWWRLDGLVYGAGNVQAGWQARLVPLVMMWPAAYVAAVASWRIWRPRPAL